VVFVGVQTVLDQIKLLGTEAVFYGKEGAGSLSPCKLQLVYKVDAACCVNKLKEMQTPKHWDPFYRN